MKTAICTLNIKYEQDVVQARKRCREIAAFLGFEQQDQTRITTAISEIARNAFQYVGSGTVRYWFVKGANSDDASRYEIEVEDHGPGIANLEQILSGKYVSKTGMGVGVTGARRLMDSFKVETSAKGTKVTLGKELPPTSPVKSAADLPRLAEKLARLAPGNAFDELRQQNQDLIEVLDKLAVTNRELEKKRALQEHFVSTLTHDLRGPLTAARGISELMQRKTPGEDPRYAKLERVLKNIDRANDMISDLLDTSQLQAGGKIPLELVYCDLSKIAREAIEEMELLTGKRFLLDAPESCPGYWCERSLRRVLDNLLSNALKYGSSEGQIHVNVSFEPGWATLVVANEGNVIPQGELTNLFEPYHRAASARESSVPGWGLGLTFVQGIAVAHGGMVKAESSLEKGTRFTIRLPVLEQENKAAGK